MNPQDKANAAFRVLHMGEEKGYTNYPALSPS